jgi:hypothetical protein
MMTGIAVHPGEHHVQNHHIELTRKRGRSPIGTVEGRGRADAFARQIFGQHLAQGGVVIDKKNVQIHLPQQQ